MALGGGGWLLLQMQVWRNYEKDDDERVGNALTCFRDGRYCDRGRGLSGIERVWLSGLYKRFQGMDELQTGNTII